jgi:DNA-binding CsgD family transcriptional regulator
VRSNAVRLCLTLNVGEGSIDGSVQSPATGEVAFGGWSGLLGAVRTVLARESGHGEERGSFQDELEVLARSAGSDLGGAIKGLEEVLRASGTHGEPFERGRILLALGRALRRAKQGARAREAFVEARRIFEQAGPQELAATAQAEIARCGNRATEGELSASEQRVAELVAEGLSNREIAAAAFISTKTVEANLARIYRKLGIRSRAQLGVYIALRAQGEPRVAGSERWNSWSDSNRVSENGHGIGISPIERVTLTCEHTYCPGHRDGMEVPT